MKKWLLDQITKKETSKRDLATRAQASSDVAELKSINAQMEAINGEIAELRTKVSEIEAQEAAKAVQAPPATPPASQAPDQRAQTQGQPPFNPLGTYAVGDGAPPADQRTQAPTDPYGTLEYRMAFMDFARTGRTAPALRPAGAEFRIDAMTQVSDVSAVVPSTILNEIIKKVTVYGQVFSRVRKTSIRGGVTVPILSLKPVATWIGETPTSDKKKVEANTNVSFSYYGLECKVSTSLLADTVTLAGFESVITDLVVEAMLIGIEGAVINGNGSGKMLGITKDARVPVAQIVTLGSDDFLAWDEWKKQVFAKMPLAYKAGATFLMASGTFEGYIDGMVDAHGQPVGRTNYGITEGPQERFGGKAVIQVEDDIIAPYDDAAVDDVVAIYCNLSNYCVNSNMQMAMFRYLDHDTNEWIDKAILIADGKLLDPNGVVIVKKGA